MAPKLSVEVIYKILELCSKLYLLFPDAQNAFLWCKKKKKEREKKKPPNNNAIETDKNNVHIYT